MNKEGKLYWRDNPQKANRALENFWFILGVGGSIGLLLVAIDQGSPQNNSVGGSLEVNGAQTTLVGVGLDVEGICLTPGVDGNAIDVFNSLEGLESVDVIGADGRIKVDNGTIYQAASQFEHGDRVGGCN